MSRPSKIHDAPDEIASLGELYGQPEEFDHTLADASFRPLNGRRTAEVAMAVRRPNGKILLQTKESYPPGVFRIPTGGLKRREGIESALLRETAEETALEVEIRQFVAILTYRCAPQEIHFRSYLFLLEETGGTLQEEDPEEGITGWTEADFDQLAATAGQLRAIEKSWQNWGRFRSLAIDALLPALHASNRDEGSTASPASRSVR